MKAMTREPPNRGHSGRSLNAVVQRSSLSSIVDHDVGSRSLSIALGALARLRVVPATWLLALAHLEDGARHGQSHAKDEPEPAKRNVRWVVEEAEERGERSEHTSGNDDDQTGEEGRKTNLALANHSCGQRMCEGRRRTGLEHPVF